MIRNVNLQVSRLTRGGALVVGFVAALLTATSLQADWPEFLGPGGNPVSLKTDLPQNFSGGSTESEKLNIAWKTDLPGRSVSGPIVVDGKVISTSSSSMDGVWLEVTALDAKTGKLLWRRLTKSTGRPYCHPTSANAAPTPCSDGNVVCAFFSSNDLVCYDLDGNLKWFRSMTDSHPLAGNDVGMSSSPVIVDGKVVVAVECQADSFAAAIDLQTGETVWEVDRPKQANWASPRVANGQDGKNVVVMQSRKSLVGVNPENGEQVWEIDSSCSAVASSVFADGKLYVPAGGLQVFELPKAFEEPVKVWDSSRLSPSSASLLVSPFGTIGLNRSVLVGVAEGGELKWRVRLPDAGQFWATPVIAGSTLYAFAMDGKCFVVDLDSDEPSLLRECELGEEVLGSPAISDGGMFVRSTSGIWRIGG